MNIQVEEMQSYHAPSECTSLLTPCVTSLEASRTPLTFGIFMEVPSHGHDQPLTAFLVSLPFLERDAAEISKLLTMADFSGVTITHPGALQALPSFTQEIPRDLGFCVRIWGQRSIYLFSLIS